MAGKILMGLALAAMIGSMGGASAFGKNDRKHMGKHDNGRYEHRERGYDHDHDHDRNRRHVKTKRVYQSYIYREQVYEPPRVIFYAPPPPPGISIFFPPIFFRP